MSFQTFTINDEGIYSSAGEPNAMKSTVGHHFGRYVESVVPEPFPYSPTDPASRTIETLWSGRRFRIKWDEKSSLWREGKVISWNESNSGPFSLYTYWNLTFELDAPSVDREELGLAIGDRVTLQDLKGKVALNGRQGRLISYQSDAGRFGVELQNTSNERKPARYALKPVNLVLDTEHTLGVHRMNVDGGGTLEGGDGHPSTETLISLEWLDSAEPKVDISYSSSFARLQCPICRLTESPPKVAFDDYSDSDLSKEATECPICLEHKKCRNLACGHEICVDCWTSMTDRKVGDITLDPLDMDQVRANRALRTELFFEKMPHFIGGTATTPADSNTRSSTILDELNKFICIQLESFVRDSRGDEEDLQRLYKNMMQEALFCFIFFDALSYLKQNLSLAGLGIFIQVFKERRISDAQLLDSLKSRFSEQYLPMDTTWTTIRCMMCTSIGEHFEGADNFLDAIPWYEAYIHYGAPLAHLFGADQIESGYLNLGLAQKRCGLLTAAQENYNQCNSNAPVCRVNREKLRKEMLEWTGTSGKLTPHC